MSAGRVSVKYRPSVGRVAVKYRRVSADISTESRPTYRPSIGRHIGRLSVDISADCRSTYRPRVSTDTQSTDALSTHDPNLFLLVTFFLEHSLHTCNPLVLLFLIVLLITK